MHIMDKAKKCEKCKGTGQIQEKGGGIHPCWDCIREGRLDVHSEKLPEHDIKI